MRSAIFFMLLGISLMSCLFNAMWLQQGMDENKLAKSMRGMLFAWFPVVLHLAIIALLFCITSKR